MDALVRDFLDTGELKGLSRYTLRNYRRSLATLERLLDKEFTEATHRDLNRCLSSYRAEGKAPGTVFRLYTDARIFFNWLESEGEISTNPFRKTTAPENPTPPVAVADAETIKKLLAVEWPTRFLARRNRAMILVLLDTGVRVSELAAMNTEDYDGKMLSIHGAKKGGPRTVPTGKAASIALRRYLRIHPGGPALWVGSKGRVTDSGVRKMLTQACRKAGVERVFPHALRHSFAHEFRLAGGSDSDLMYLGGWSSPRQLERYGAAGKVERAAAAHSRYSPGDRLASG
ncbi:tyrosine-type recombinase/integrase [Streptomonospora sp. PA3]|uniref:tyrosine-type recombinase/integrase n=1 Tax=Streptomonospora sp. PA3 TaxID=2607326 RepID=UPI0012DE7725|nr:tyrosine-type recombinase/integrase [Streptomonospora sp. PA3]MUL40246.1 tyrosine-type recombinase/integrase [Streptomonospora sp. PA3]